ncbi:NrdR family transcriptional regulator [Methylorubrum suomiense]|uniref:NrdR family transcriptional regulator n=1 Tax=Methylorubrum suomiense TaxID=144191 RepID=UPI003570CA1A
MICPKCSAETKVVSSRPHKDNARVIQRRRACEGCGHRFNTQEGLADLVRMRRNETRRATAYFQRLDPAVRKARNARRILLRDARIEAAETGRAVSEILEAWNVPPSPASPSQAQR